MDTTIDEITKLKSGTPAEKMAVLSTLAKQQTPAAIGLLTDCLADPKWVVRKHSCELLIGFGPRLIEHLAKVLASGNEDQKFWVVKALVALGKDSVPVLIKALNKGSKSMRIHAASALGEIGDAVAIPYLVAGLGDGIWRVRRNCYEALLRYGDKTLGDLRKAIFSENEDVAFWAAKCLGKLGEKSREILLEALKTGSNQLKFIIAAALGETGDTRVINILISNCKESSWIVQKRSSEALAEIGALAVPAISQALVKATEPQNFWLLSALAHMADAGVGALEKLLVEEGENFRWNVKELLARIGEPTLPVLERLTRHKDKEVRFFAINCLGDLPASASTDAALLRGLTDQAWSIRKISADALVSRGAVVLDRLNLALDTGDEDLRFWVTYIFRKMGTMGLQYLIKALGDSNKNIAYFAAGALGDVKNPQVVHPLIRALSDPYWPVRKQASESLRKLAELSVPQLINHINDEDENVQHWVLKTITAIGPAGTADIIRLLKKGNEEQRFFAARALGVIKDPVAVEALAEALSDGNEWVRLYAAIALGEQGDTRAISHLIRSLGEPSFKMHTNISELFHKFGEKAVPELLLALKNDNLAVVKNSLKILGSLQARTALDEIKAFLVHQSEELRVTAAEALACFKQEPDTVEVLFKQLARTTSERSRLRILLAVGDVGREEIVPPLVEVLEISGNQRERDTVMGLLVGMAERAIPSLVNLLANPRVTARKSSAEVLLRVGERVRPYVEASLTRDDPNVHYWCSKILRGLDEAKVATARPGEAPPQPERSEG
ncbi:MAG: HEAT repeat domain-containing protein [Candidatus Wallbacteria bacterium]|nr:HEAT repeat domain-containing protein [Candidatus Wallbacteria bacterium]